jgi:N-acetyl-D-muramate 6-phosphate phosphatase
MKSPAKLPTHSSRPSPDSSPRAVLFDLDGTLLDTAPDMAGALNKLLHLHGRPPLAFNDVRPHVSHGSTALVRLGFPHTDATHFETLRQQYLEIYSQHLAEHTQLFDGVDAALNRLETEGIPWGVVTNKPGWLTEPLLEQLELRHRARVVVSGDTLKERKPHPAPLLHAIRELGFPPEDCIYIGDAERDVLAGQAAGIKVFVALFGYIPANERPEEWPAAGWLRDPTEMVSLLDSLI